MKEIFDLEVLSKELEASELFEDEEGNKYQSIYLGSVYSVMPSGKFYMPFAHSNLDVCEAYQDELWAAQAEKELESIEACLHYDGDDIFINKYI